MALCHAGIRKGSFVFLPQTIKQFSRGREPARKKNQPRPRGRGWFVCRMDRGRVSVRADPHPAEHRADWRGHRTLDPLARPVEAADEARAAPAIAVEAAAPVAMETAAPVAVESVAPMAMRRGGCGGRRERGGAERGGRGDCEQNLAEHGRLLWFGCGWHFPSPHSGTRGFTARLGAAAPEAGLSRE